MAAAIAAATDAFASVDNGDDAALAGEREFLWRNRYLLSPAVTPERFTARRAARAPRGGPAAPRFAGRHARAAHPAAIPAASSCKFWNASRAQARPATREGVWFSPTAGAHCSRADPGRRLRHRRAGTLAGAIRAAFAKPARATRSCSCPGPGVFSVSTRARIKARRTALLADRDALIARLLLAAYRSPRVCSALACCRWRAARSPGSRR